MSDNAAISEKDSCHSSSISVDIVTLATSQTFALYL